MKMCVERWVEVLKKQYLEEALKELKSEWGPWTLGEELQRDIWELQRIDREIKNERKGELK